MALKLNYNIKLEYKCFDNIEILKKIDATIVNKTIKTITIPNTYIKITNLEGNKDNVNINVSIYDKKYGNIIDKKYYDFIPSVADGAENFIKQGYEYLKTLEEYKDAVDLLD